MNDTNIYMNMFIQTYTYLYICLYVHIYIYIYITRCTIEYVIYSSNNKKNFNSSISGPHTYVSVPPIGTELSGLKL
jgi:hypothetical protein